jgi:hypothetical protein
MEKSVKTNILPKYEDEYRQIHNKMLDYNMKLCNHNLSDEERNNIIKDLEDLKARLKHIYFLSINNEKEGIRK